jgi:hypothetical protein
MVITNMSIFLQRSIYCRKAAANSSLAMVGGDPLQALPEGALAQLASCQL